MYIYRTFDARTNAGKHFTSNITRARNQRCTKYLVFWLLQMMLWVMRLLISRHLSDQMSFQMADKRGVNTSFTRILYKESWKSLSLLCVEIRFKTIVSTYYYVSFLPRIKIAKHPRSKQRKFQMCCFNIKSRMCSPYVPSPKTRLNTPTNPLSLLQ